MSRANPTRKPGNPAWIKGGKSPHPGGRSPKRAELAAKIQERGMDLVTKLFDLADGKGKPSPRERIEALKILLAYGFGLPGAHIELSGPGGGPVETREVPLETLTTGELRARLAELEGRRVEREGAEVGNQSFAERP